MVVKLANDNIPYEGYNKRGNSRSAKYVYLPSLLSIFLFVD